MIGARIEPSRRENKGRVHRLNCGAPRPNGRGRRETKCRPACL